MTKGDIFKHNLSGKRYKVTKIYAYPDACEAVNIEDPQDIRSIRKEDLIDGLYHYSDDDKTAAQKAEEAKNYCFHDWVTYIGLKEKFYYCTKCDEKKEYVE